jgi:hypothetical protein
MNVHEVHETSAPTYIKVNNYNQQSGAHNGEQTSAYDYPDAASEDFYPASMDLGQR